jgi:hypothetical protein
MDEIHMWYLGLLVPIILAFIGIWWKVESRQDRAICALRKENKTDHGNLHDKIDETRDMVTDLWKHLVSEKGKRR